MQVAVWSTYEIDSGIFFFLKTKPETGVCSAEALGGFCSGETKYLNHTPACTSARSSSARLFSHRATCFVTSRLSCTLASCISKYAGEWESVHVFDPGSKLSRLKGYARKHKNLSSAAFVVSWVCSSAAELRQVDPFAVSAGMRCILSEFIWWTTLIGGCCTWESN